MTKYLECGGCGKLYNPTQPSEMLDMDTHDCNAPCEYHTLGILDVYRETVTCEECGYTEDADPDDLAEQRRLLAEMDKA